MAKSKHRLEPPMTLTEWKWKKVKKYYEAIYKIKFKKIPEEPLLDELYKKIHALGEDFDNYLQKRPDLADKLK